MSNKTNEEKLRILQERLASIQHKKEIHQEEKIQENKPVTPVFEEDLVTEPETESNTTKKKGSAWNIIFFLILFSCFGGFGYYFYDNDFKINPAIDNIKKDLNTLFGSDDNLAKDDKKRKKVIDKEDKKQNIIYDKSSFDGGNFIIILHTSDKQEQANNERDKLIQKGYPCGVFLLAAVSNSKKEVFQTFIGPTNTKNEARQYLNNQSISEYNGEIIELQ